MCEDPKQALYLLFYAYTLWPLFFAYSLKTLKHTFHLVCSLVNIHMKPLYWTTSHRYIEFVLDVFLRLFDRSFISQWGLVRRRNAMSMIECEWDNEEKTNLNIFSSFRSFPTSLTLFLCCTWWWTHIKLIQWLCLRTAVFSRTKLNQRETI